MNECYTRRDLFRMIGLGTLGLGFGVSIYDGIYKYADAGEEQNKHMLS
jgi:hypothetical protein